MNPNIEEQMAYSEVMKTLEDVTITNEWMLKYRLENKSIFNFQMSDNILNKLKENKIQYERIREQRRKETLHQML